MESCSAQRRQRLGSTEAAADWAERLLGLKGVSTGSLSGIPRTCGSAELDGYSDGKRAAKRARAGLL
ncbi:hypothetical protein M0R45_001169 [Rubus argutus]|uniref:Uncharacterized protein n=1 Tax=Rubus argutus TaxID=59490 RepID=A0AAW1VI72_RUBAR